MEQLFSQVFLQVLDLLAHGSLGDVEVLRGPDEAFVTSRGFEDPESAQLRQARGFPFRSAHR